MIDKTDEQREEGQGGDQPVGAQINLEELKRGDGLLSRPTQVNQSLLHRTISSIKENAEFRQELKQLNFQNSDEPDDLISALDECEELGMSQTPVINTALARSAGLHHELLFKVYDTLTHNTFTTNYKKDAGGNKKPSSPLS